MSLFSSGSPPSSPTSALRTPASKRISLPASDRLSTITEGGQGGSARPNPTSQPVDTTADPNAASPPYSRPGTGRSRPVTPTVPPRSILRNSPYNNNTNGHPGIPSSTAVSTRTAPPAYTWVPEPMEPVDAPGEQEKLSQLRRAAHATKGRRGGWGRLLLIGGVILLIVIGLAVGLGVGLTVGRHNNGGSDSGQSATGSTSTSPSQDFPLGQYSFVTNLRSVATNCTSNANTWRCYPYSSYDPASPGSASTSQSTFDWIITNTSSTFATNTSQITSSAGIPANLSISSTSNPFSVTFQNQALTYISSQGNSTDARLTFSFTSSKSVIPSAPLTSDNAATQCFYNSTVFSATLYLRAPSTIPTSNSTTINTGSTAQWEDWPTAVEISQESPGGQDVPACYLTLNGGGVGDRVTTGLQPQSASSECLCDYRNF